MKRCPKCNRAESDDSLAFCRADGTRLVSDGSFVSEGAGTLRFRSAPTTGGTETRLLPTGEAAGTPPAPAAVLDGGRASGHTRGLSGAKSRRGILIALAAVLAVALAASAYLHLSRGNTGAAKKSIAVLPFQNASGNPDVEYLSDGITESIINSLSQLPGVRVMARSTMFSFKGKDADPRAVGKQLGVEAVLTGRVVQRGDSLTVQAELVNVADGSQLWGEQFNRKLTDLVALQGEMARDVSSRLRTKLSGADERKLAKKQTENAEAYRLYLQGRFHWNKRTGESLKQAIEYYNQAVEKDPNFALAYSGLAETYVVLPLYSVAPPTDIMPRARATALRALELDDSLAEAHAALGSYLAYFEFDRVGAEKQYRRSIELNPNYATAHQWLGNNVLNPTKRFDEALAELRRAEEIDPLSPIVGTNLGDSLVYRQRYEEAISQYKRVLSLYPDFAFARFALGWAYHAKGMYREAIAEFRNSLELGYDPTTKGFLGMSLAKSGRRDEATELLRQLKQESSQRYVTNTSLAYIHIGLGEKAEALGLLEKDVAERASYTCFFAIDPVYDDLRADPRFKAILQRLNLPE